MYLSNNTTTSKPEVTRTRSEEEAMPSQRTVCCGKNRISDSSRGMEPPEGLRNNISGIEESPQPFMRNMPNLILAFSFVGVTVLFYLFPCVWLTRNVTIAVPILRSLFMIFTVSSYALCLCMNPGIIARDSVDVSGVLDAPEVMINGTIFTSKWCHICKIYRPPRCRHCYSCDVCIEDLDHHCFFLKKCIGKRNHRFFYTLLFSLTVYFLLMLSFCTIFLVKNPNALFLSKITTFILATILLLASVPLFFFFAFHTYLIAAGMTTYEQILRTYQSDKNPFHKGCWRNFTALLFGNQLSSCKTVTEVTEVTVIPGHLVECPSVSSKCADTTSTTFISILSRSNAVVPLPVTFVPTLPNRPQSAPLPTFSYLNENSGAPFQTLSSQLLYLPVTTLSTHSPDNTHSSSLSL
ncbi:palmitoyltransferase ZDHHC5-A-like isoform X2 [Leucoraja erinacea]|uniref:palmitoyltransferase ZDHHC5-A-like isoform X2 n=1 Tax=Leucoraja erinaceus TaxID=7782 RepID=UPI0024545036|nr:palmitoyltransferase ZDHHC5-A-like isoform X2 [Leucoraja erinacea]